MVERFDATSITGWAAGADGAIGELQLRIDEQPVTLPIRRFDRHDVADALGAPRGGLYGFEVMLPPWIWSLVPPRGESRITVCADGQPINRPMTLSCAPFNTWLRRYAAVIPGTTGAPLAPDTPGAGAIDGIDGLLVSGWLRNPPDSNAPIEVLCAGQPIDCTIVSVDRPEVRAALGSASQASGFEFLLPGLIWQHSDASGSLQIHVRAGGQDLSASPLRIEATLLEREIANLRAADPASAQHGSVLDPAECQYRSLLLLEHATAVPSIANLSSSASDWLREEAARYGLIGTLAKRHAEGALADQSPINLPADDGTAVHWRVLRDINDRLAGGAHEIWPAFADAFAKTTTTEQRWQLLGATMPTICTLGYAPRLQGYVDQAVLARLTQADDVWGLSLALAIVAAQGDIAQATELLERMLPLMHHGWLNTECMHAAATLVVERLSHGDIEPPVAESFFSALVKTLESYGHVHASRTHDHQLIACMTTLLRGSPWMTDATCRRVAQVALRRFGLQPDFWRLIDADVSNGELSVGDPLRAARATFDRIHARLQQGQWARWPDLQHLDDELQPLRTLGCGECDIVQRQALQALLQLDEKPDAEAIRSLLAVSERMSREEVLRSVAFPGAHGGDIISALDDLSDRIRAFRIVATNPNLAMQRAACEGLLELSRAARSAPIAIDAAAVDELTAKIAVLTHPGAGWVGIGLRAALWALLRDRGQNATSHLAAIREAMLRACAEVHANEPPPAALTDALHLLILANLRQPDSAIITLVDDVKHRCVEAHPRIAEALAGACSPAHPMALPADPGNDTIVIIYSCRKYLGTRIEAIRSTWVRDLVAWGVPYLIVVGDGDDRVDGDVLALDVSDRYEDLPGKSLKMIQWVFEHTGYQHLYKIDDDCFVDVRKLFGGGLHRAHHYYGRRLHRDPGSTDRVWHQGKSSTTRAAHAIDKSPEPSTYADGGCGYNLSRFAMASILIAATSDRGQRLIRNSFMEDKLVGDLLSLTGISIADHDYHTMIRRRTFAQATPVNLWDNVFLPSRHSPTVMVHLDTETHMASVRAQRDMSDLLPKRLWPTHARPSLVWSSSQLEQLSPASRMRELRDAPMVVVAVARNESLLLPHFLAHYRRLGASHFVIVDNLSTDGTRELALEQPDVTVYSCDTDYKHSHFGVTWQETVLGAHRLGRWALVADLDEFLVYGDSDSQPLPALAASLQAEGADAARAYMIDMYPKGDLADADFKTAPPFLAANCHDRAPLIRWRLGAGSFSNAPTFVSALRHRLIPNSAPNMYTSQKIALLRYQPWMRFSEGLHYAAGVRMAQRPLAFAHFKYHRGFRAKVLDEVARKQHFDNASEYRRYMNMLSEASAVFFDSDLSQEYAGADSLCEMLQALQSAP